MTKSKSAKMLVAFVCVVVMLFTYIPSSFASAFSYPKISFGKTQKGKLQDYFGGVSYEFQLKQSTKVLINYSSSVNSNLTIYDQKLNTITKFSNIKKVKKDITLKKGTYVFGIYNCTYGKGTYSLKLTDNGSSNVKISFASSVNYLKVSDSITLNLIKQPKNGNVKNIVFSSSNKNIATVNSKGKVKAKALGKTTITAKLGKNQTAKCDVIVNQGYIQVFQSSKKSLPKINGKSLAFYVKSTSIATITNKKLKGITHGSTTLSAYDGGYYYYLNAKVISRKTLNSKATKKLKSKDKLAKIRKKYKGYNDTGKACVVFSYTSSSKRNKYFMAYYNDAFNLKTKIYKSMPKLKSQKTYK